MDSEPDQSRFDRALNEVEKHGGSVRLTSWPTKKQIDVPETSASWCDIATMLRDYVVETNSGVSISVMPKGRSIEQFEATWKKAAREPFENETSLHEPAMDTLIFRDGGKFHFDCWSEGKPYTMLTPEVVGVPSEPSFLSKVANWFFNHLNQVIGAVVIAAILAWLGFGGS